MTFSEDFLDDIPDDRINEGADEPGAPAPEEETDVLRVSIAAAPPSLNELLKMHWGDVHDLKKQWALLIQGKTRDAVKTPTRLEYHRQGKELLDVDNLYASAKVPIDACCHAGVIPDDDPEALDSLQASQSRGDPHTVLRFVPAG